MDLCGNIAEDFENEGETEMYVEMLDELLEIELAYLADNINNTTDGDFYE